MTDINQELSQESTTDETSGPVGGMRAPQNTQQSSTVENETPQVSTNGSVENKKGEMDELSESVEDKQKVDSTPTDSIENISGGQEDESKLQVSSFTIRPGQQLPNDNEVRDINIHPLDNESKEVSNISVRSTNKDKEVSDISVRSIDDKKKSLDQDFKEGNKGHYEEKPSGYLFWGFVLCACVLSFPLGGGFAFLLAPAQAASMGLCVFWKRGKRKVWVVDKKSNPGDKLVTVAKNKDKLTKTADGKDKALINNVSGKEGLITTKQGAENIVSSLTGSGNTELSPKAQKELAALGKTLETLSASGIDGIDSKDIKDLSKMLSDPEQFKNIAGVIKDENMAEIMDKLANASKLPQNERDAIANELAKKMTSAISKLPEAKEIITPKLEQNLAKAISSNNIEAIKQSLEPLKQVKDASSNKTNGGKATNFLTKSQPQKEGSGRGSY